MMSTSEVRVGKTVTSALRGLAVAVASVCAACGGGEESTGLSIEIHGPQDGNDPQTPGFPDEANAPTLIETIRLSAYSNDRRAGLTEAAWNAAKVSLPTIPYGRPARVVAEAMNEGGDVVASGATPTFELSASDPAVPRTILTMVPAEFREAFYWNAADGVSAPLRYESAGSERVGHTLTALADGSAHVVIGGAKMSASGGIQGSGITSLVSTIEYYDDIAGDFLTLFETGCQGSVADCALQLPGGGSAFHTATALPDGRVLIAGGLRVSTIGGTEALVPSAEVWVLTITGRGYGELDRVSGDGVARAFHTATLLPDGRVLLIGGIGLVFAPEPTFQARVDVVTTDDLFVEDSGATLAVPRAWHTAAYLDAGGHGVLVTGGAGPRGAVIGTSEIVYLNGSSFATDAFSPSADTHDLQVARWGHSAVKFGCPGSDEEFVAILGGFTAAGADLLHGSAPTDTIEIYSLESFQSNGGYSYIDDTYQLPGGGRGFGSAVELPLSRDLLYVGGIGADGTASSVASRLVSNWSCPDFAAQASLTRDVGRRVAFGAVGVLANGFALVTGGFDGTASTETNTFYNPNDYRLPDDYP
ncbi:MAG: hypothetical protein H6699_06375 [Myxococcales bacterium]|nr:hypothetical protein [Myxococcales bacterium]